MRKAWCLWGVSILIVGVFIVSPLDAADVLRIENELLAVEFDAGQATFAAIAKPSGSRFIERGLLREGGGRATRHEVSDTIWGSGEAIEVEYDAGGSDRLALFQGLPFAVLTSRLANPGSEARTVDRIAAMGLTLDLGKPVADLRAFGTAGLTEVGGEANPGSYSFLAVVEPDSRAGVVAGWVSHDRGSGVLFSDVKDGKPVVDGRLDYGKLLIEPGRTVK